MIQQPNGILNHLALSYAQRVVATGSDGRCNQRAYRPQAVNGKAHVCHLVVLADRQRIFLRFTLCLCLRRRWLLGCLATAAAGGRTATRGHPKALLDHRKDVANRFLQQDDALDHLRMRLAIIIIDVIIRTAKHGTGSHRRGTRNDFEQGCR